MRTLLLALLAAVALVAASGRSSASPPAAVPVQPGLLERLEWMAGCWEAATPRMVIHEQWMRPAGGSMLGMSRTVSGDSTVSHEFMRLVEREGRVVFVVHPSGQAEAEFVATTASETGLTLSNPAHDFPQRILYRAAGTDSLLARIEGTIAGNERAIDFPYVRVACP
jgi:hypothetical protein